MYSDKDAARGIDGTFMWLMEEVGELAGALRQGSAEELAGGIRRRSRVAGHNRQRRGDRPASKPCSTNTAAVARLRPDGLSLRPW